MICRDEHDYHEDVMTRERRSACQPSEMPFEAPEAHPC